MGKILEDLENLQELDLVIEHLKRFVDNYSLYQRQLELEFEEQKKAFLDMKNALENLHKTLKKGEIDLSEGEERLKKCQAQLYQVKTNREYEAMLKEIEEQKIKNSELEERILVLYDEVEKESKKLKEAELKFQSFQREHELKKEELEKKFNLAQKKLAEEIRRHSGLLEELDRLARATYLRIKERLGNPVLARVVDGVCQLCFRKIPAQMYNDLLKGDKVITCPSCHRIMVYREREFLVDEAEVFYELRTK